MRSEVQILAVNEAVNTSTVPSDSAGEESAPHFCTAALSAALLWLVGCFLYLAQVSATHEFRGFGLLWAAMLTGGAAVYGIPSALILGIGLGRMHRRKRLPRWMNPKCLSAFGLAGMLLAIVVGRVESRPEALIEQKVGIDGRSLKQLKVSGFDSFLAKRWLFSFDANPDDANRIVSQLNLGKSRDCNFSGVLKEDIFLRKLPILAPGEAKVFSRRQKHLQSSYSLLFAFDEKSGRAWMLVGYQN